MQGMTVDEAVSHLSAVNVLQPVLFCTDGQYFVKLDNTSMHIHEPSCFADCIEFLLQIFFVFDVQYPAELDKLLEIVLSVPHTSLLTAELCPTFTRAFRECLLSWRQGRIKNPADHTLNVFHSAGVPL